MNENYFLEEAVPPDPVAIKVALGDKYPWYEGVLEAAKGFQADWKHYGKKYGWKLKVHDGEKALFELTIASGDFRVGIAARERELEALRAESPVAADLVKEGWGIRIVVVDAAEYDRARALIKAVAELRRNG